MAPILASFSNIGYFFYSSSRTALKKWAEVTPLLCLPFILKLGDVNKEVKGIDPSPLLRVPCVVTKSSQTDRYFIFYLFENKLSTLRRLTGK